MAEPAKKQLCVLGSPVSHSLSPAIHTAALRSLGMDGEWSYEAIEVAPEEFEPRVRALPAEGFVGANVTIPHKLVAIALADSASSAAREIGAANTLSFAGDQIHADNTDGEGLLASLPLDPAGAPALVLGAGGAARAAVWALRGAGARVSVWNRTRTRAEELAEALGVSVADPDPATGTLPAAEYIVIVNTTTIGMSPPGHPGADLKALHLDADSFTDGQSVVDLVYGHAETELVRAARERGAQAIDGREVLVHQGAASFRIWTGVEPSLEAMREAARP